MCRRLTHCVRVLIDNFSFGWRLLSTLLDRRQILVKIQLGNSRGWPLGNFTLHGLVVVHLQGEMLKLHRSGATNLLVQLLNDSQLFFDSFGPRVNIVPLLLVLLLEVRPVRLLFFLYVCTGHRLIVRLIRCTRSGRRIDLLMLILLFALFVFLLGGFGRELLGSSGCHALLASLLDVPHELITLCLQLSFANLVDFFLRLDGFLSGL